jgi:hypothetical protein
VTIPMASFAVLLSGTPAWSLPAEPRLLRPWALGLNTRVRRLSEDPRGGARLVLWRDSVKMAAQRPVATALGFYFILGALKSLPEDNRFLRVANLDSGAALNFEPRPPW